MPTQPTRVEPTSTFEIWRLATNTISSDLGNIVDLNNNIADHTNVVAVVNELQTKVGLSVAKPLVGANSTDLVGAVNEIRSSAVSLYSDKLFANRLAATGDFIVGAQGVQGLQGTQGITAMA